MIDFLIRRPIAVIMTFLAILTLGIVASRLLPVSLMPEIDIPEITIQLNRPGESARQIEEGIIAPMRYNLMQVPHLEELTSESSDGRAVIRLRFSFGADINYAFIDVNEKTDEAMRHLPADMERPAIIKATASDLPVFYINIWMDDSDEVKFMELSDLTRSVIIKRLEQQQEVAMVDVTGHMQPELYIEPNEQLLRSLGVSHQVIVNALEQNNLSMGSIEVADGQYRFNIRFANRLRTVDDVKDIRLKIGTRLMRMEELAKIGLRPKQQEGVFLRNGVPAMSLAVIKQSDARMDVLKERVEGLLWHFRNNYQGIHFEIVRDQTAILDYSISNLQTNLLFGGMLAFLILFFFLKDARSPWLIGISVPASLIISLLFFHLAGLSINIISLSGLILGIGMIIDNSIIVIDNITQYTERGETLANACIKGTNEVIRPLISSVLTTCAVFVPLIFISGVSGALFYDQAMAVGIGLLASLIVSITLIPVLFHLFNRKSKNEEQLRKGRVTRFLEKINLFKTETLYEKGFEKVFRHRIAFILLFLGLIIPAFLLAFYMPKERFPAFTHNDVFLVIDWDANITLSENIQRVNSIKTEAARLIQFSNSYTGTQNYMLHKDLDQSISEAKVYLKCNNEDDVEKLKKHLSGVIASTWPGAIFTFEAPETIFEKLFHQDEAQMVFRVSDESERGIPELSKTTEIVQFLSETIPGAEVMPPASDTHIEIRARSEMMALYNVDHQVLYNRLLSAMNAFQVGVLHTGAGYVPMVIGNSPVPVNRMFNELKVINRENTEIPVSTLISVNNRNDYKVLYGSTQGAFVPLNIDRIPRRNVGGWLETTGGELKERFDVNVNFSGNWFAARQMLKEMSVVILISLLLLYFILAAQFESLRQPLIILLEVPIDVAGALFLLWIFGGTINIMSMIGIVVMSGIIVNDSILKIDTINRLYRAGMPLEKAIKEGGRRRLKPIIMTSITTILALTPVMWGSGMGSELQKPLALTVIGGMVLGTFVSLYFIPLCYYYLCKKGT
ncbi:efflux RND transporter permease subunit [Natronoflexus pectinivorans]|uniref:Multidrug efflux pump subunit AcrB n=1 Tax=Natronoflexus pectinivorans TaxID=682526 RepID=A0A4R2G9Q6_9BACT|nr:efflux RND transporter permease subunit [Natronoflexus pectinivorans]TCO04422.1 multidrug efflux pump subunit AcrB [Natronoflexus pectinivorans]